jgi:hypothetical protein
VKPLAYVIAVLLAAAFVSPAVADKPPKDPGHSGNPSQPENPAPGGSEGNSNKSGSHGKPSSPGDRAAHRSKNTELPGPGATVAAKAKAYGRYCQNQSKQHVAGQTGTPYRQCLTAMAKLATGVTRYAWTACGPLSRRPIPGQAGSPFSRCVVAGTRLLDELRKPIPNGS